MFEERTTNYPTLPAKPEQEVCGIYFLVACCINLLRGCGIRTSICLV